MTEELLWHHAENGLTQGPSTFSEVADKIRADLHASHLVWRTGMIEWREARELPEFASVFPVGPPPLPPSARVVSTIDGRAAPASTVGYSRPNSRAAADLHPWRRFFARTLDLLIFGALFGFALGFLFPFLFVGDKAKITAVFLNFGIALVYVPVEAFLLFAFGTTPGKAIYRIRIARGTEPVSAGDAFSRAFLVCLKGLGLGIPIVSLIAEIVAYNRLKKQKITSWDEQLGWAVSHGKIGVVHWVGVALAWALIVAVIGVSANVANS